MIDPNSPLVTAALNSWMGGDWWDEDDGEYVADYRADMARALNAALAEHMRLSGPVAALSLPSDLTAIAKEERT